AQVRVTLRVDADFADVFSVKEGRVQPQRRTINARPSGVLVIHGERGQGVRVSMTDATYGPDGLVAVVDLAPSQEVVLVAEARPTWRQTGGVHLVGPPKRPLLWRHSWLSSPDATVPHVVERSLTDLESLRISDPDDPSAV